MEHTYSVAVSYGKDVGWIRQPLTLEVPHETLMDFTQETIDPQGDRASFELALTRLWEATQVHVDWSRPVEYVKTHPRYE